MYGVICVLLLSYSLFAGCATGAGLLMICGTAAEGCDPFIMLAGPWLGAQLMGWFHGRGLWEQASVVLWISLVSMSYASTWIEVWVWLEVSAICLYMLLPVSVAIPYFILSSCGTLSLAVGLMLWYPSAGLDLITFNVMGTGLAGVLIWVGFSFKLYVWPSAYWVASVLENSGPIVAWWFSLWGGAIALIGIDRVSTSGVFTDSYTASWVWMTVCVGWIVACFAAWASGGVWSIVGHGAYVHMGWLVSLIVLGESKLWSTYLIWYWVVLWMLGSFIIANSGSNGMGVGIRYTWAGVVLVFVWSAWIGVPIAWMGLWVKLWLSINLFSSGVSTWVIGLIAGWGMLFSYIRGIRLAYFEGYSDASGIRPWSSGGAFILVGSLMTVGCAALI
jgi:hypothetical protein